MPSESRCFLGLPSVGALVDIATLLDVLTRRSSGRSQLVGGFCLGVLQRGVGPLCACRRYELRYYRLAVQMCDFSRAQPILVELRRDIPEYESTKHAMELWETMSFILNTFPNDPDSVVLTEEDGATMSCFCLQRIEGYNDLLRLSFNERKPPYELVKNGGQIPLLFDTLRSSGSEYKGVAVNMAGLPYLDGTGLAIVIYLLRFFHSKNMRVTVYCVESRVIEFIELCRLSQVLNICQTESDSIVMMNSH